MSGEFGRKLDGIIEVAGVLNFIPTPIYYHPKLTPNACTSGSHYHPIENGHVVVFTT